MKKITLSLLAVVFAIGVVAAPIAANAQFGMPGTLGDIFVLDSLFGVGGDGFTTLGDAFMLDQLFMGPAGIAGGGVAGPGGAGTLGDLFVLANLFAVGTDGFVGLGDVFLLDQLFGGPVAVPF